MTQKRLPAVFMRGGSSKGVFFKLEDLPFTDDVRDQILLDAIGSPDVYGRQLNGMGGGVSSVSKAVILNVSERADADIDYTFAQVAVDQPIVDFSTTCGILTPLGSGVPTEMIDPSRTMLRMRISTGSSPSVSANLLI